MRARWAIVALALAASGCASGTIRGTMHYHPEQGEQARQLLWPSPPEVPRYTYFGELLGQQNFRADEDLKQGAQGVLFAILGVFSQTEEPVVLQRPQSGVVDEQTGRIYVTDVSRGAVYVFDEKEGELLIWEQAQGLTRFDSPTGIALGRGGEILVADSVLKAVYRLDSKGKPVGVIGKGVLTRPVGVARDPARGVVYVVDTQAHDVKMFSDEGELLSVIGHRSDKSGGLNFPTYASFVRGELYVADTMNSRIQVFSAEGEPVRSLGQRGLFVGNLVRPKGIGVDDEGNVYVVESYYDHLLVFSPDGQFLMGIGGNGVAPGRFYLPAGVWVDSRNRVFVADMFNGRIAIFQFLGGRDG